MDKILVIGQAPPYVAQSLPYDTTMFYDWLQEIGISKLMAKDIFEFEAVYDKFPGFSNGNHKPPAFDQMATHYTTTLKSKMSHHNKILILGKVAHGFLLDKIGDKKTLVLMHPSKRNYALFQKHRDIIIDQLREFIAIETSPTK